MIDEALEHMDFFSLLYKQQAAFAEQSSADCAVYAVMQLSG